MGRKKNEKRNGQIHPDQSTEKENQNSSSSRAELRSAASQSNVNVAVPENEHKEKTEENDKPQLVSFMGLFRFADGMDFIYMLIGSIAALAHGAAFPIMLLIFGELTDTFTGQATNICNLNYTVLNEFCPPNVTLTYDNIVTDYMKCNISGLPSPDDFLSNIRQQSIWLTILGCGTIVIGYFQVTFWSIACERQTRRLRERLLRSILEKEISYFDTNKTGELNTRLAEDVNQVHDGTGDKVGSALQFVATFFAGLILGLLKGWKLTLVILSVSPILFVSAVLVTRVMASMTSRELKAYAKAGAIAQEVFSSIRTVFSYNGAAYESRRYEEHLESAKKSGIKKGMINGVLFGSIWLIIFCTYALGFWYGAKLVREDEFSIGKILIVFFSIITAVFSLGQTAPHVQSIAQARGAAFALWNIIDTPSKINSQSPEGLKKENLVGDVRFSNVQFSYPARPDVQVLNNLSFTAVPGETTALVGTSGCGKSTCMQLLQRFYDPLDGSVEIDGVPVNQYQLTWLRQQIGVVSQEPILFQTSIKENIRFGRSDATQEEIEAAAKMANAHDFIMQLTEKYNTPVGQLGSQLSGGQKQRIAIARALIRNPRILLLDEATSALDTESERLVQEALDRASKGRTTIVIAHRLSTIVNASKIIVMNKGSVIEEGDHESLLAAGGVYHGLVQAQKLRSNKTEDDHVSDDSDIENDAHEHVTDVRVRSLSDHRSYEKQMSKEEKVEEQNEEKSDDKTEYSGPSPFFSMLKKNRPELAFIIIGCFSCICNGGIQPAFGVILSKVIAVFSNCNAQEQEKMILMYILIFIGLGFLMLVTMFLQSFLFAKSGESLTKRLRSEIFRTLMKQEVAYFDQPENNTGALCTRLATEAADVQGATGIRIGTMLQNFANLGVGIILAFIYGWSLTLLMLAFIPFMITAGFLQTYLLTGFANRDKQALEKAGKVAVEAISNIRTVAQLTKERHFGDEYSRLLDIPYRNSLKRAHVFGVLFGFTDAILFFAQAALFSFGAWRVEKGAMKFEDIMLVLNCILFGAMAVGQAASLAPNYSKAIDSSKKILNLLARTPTIDNSSTNGIILENYQGEINFNDLEFRYPTRLKIPVLRNFNLKIEPNQQVALVGSSGCGKSTIIQLIEYFYDTTQGTIIVGDHELPSVNLQWWRQQIGFVSQEPVLFDSSIRENIAYGDTSRQVPMEEIYAAARSANIHNFIENLPDKYETNVGSKGTQLSGGEKQRIAIARALIRNPKLLLLDEATSALDTESERIVQEALDHAAKGRTTIIIAHRLSTIQNSDVICVLHRGAIVEFGKHDDLMAKRGYYYRLAQSKL